LSKIYFLHYFIFLISNNIFLYFELLHKFVLSIYLIKPILTYTLRIKFIRQGDLAINITF